MPYGQRMGLWRLGPEEWIALKRALSMSRTRPIGSPDVHDLVGHGAIVQRRNSLSSERIIEGGLHCHELGQLDSLEGLS